MKLTLLILIIGIICIVSGYVQQLDPKCKPKSEIKIIPRNVYDQLIEDSSLNY